jgi:hypothetical protein
MDSNKPSSAKGFDPFNDRPSRTVRNTLSQMLADHLARRQVFPEGLPEVLRQYSQAPYRDYIRDRAVRYRTVTREALAAGGSAMDRVAILWRHGLYFEAHEILEPIWQASTGAEREGLQGLIQAAGAHVHQAAGHPAAAASLARKAIDRLHRFGFAIGDRQALDLNAWVAHLASLISSSEDPDT